MIILQEPHLSDFTNCPYIPGNQCRYEYFFAFALADTELNELLKRGWRKFGTYFFKPNCEGCRKCIPLRVRVKDFSASKSQKRVLKKGGNIKIQYGALEYRDEIYELYRDHSLKRFNQETNTDSGIHNLY